MDFVRETRQPNRPWHCSGNGPTGTVHSQRQNWPLCVCRLFSCRVRFSRTMTAGRIWLLGLLLCATAFLCRCLDKEDVIFAVNAGGEAHVDSYGILYQRDFNRVGTESDYGKKLSIQRVKPHDQILYQTERYSQTTFGYDIPIMQDGDYVMVLKFSEVYFTNSGLKVIFIR